jgi:hypothetical protein
MGLLVLSDNNNDEMDNNNNIEYIFAMTKKLVVGFPTTELSSYQSTRASR